jgi:hypothetical protein
MLGTACGLTRFGSTTRQMDRDRSRGSAAAHGRVGRIVVRGEFGPLLGAALPECEIAVLSGETHVTAYVRDEAELYGRLDGGETAAFVRLRIDNRGRSTARNVVVSVLKVHRWDPASAAWIRSRPELDGRLLQPSNQLASQPAPVDVFPHSDRIVDLTSVDWKRVSEGASPIFIEITHPWPPNEASVLEPAT